jgi:hypothetical protein
MQTHPGTLNELRRCTYARADRREVPTVAFHWDQAQRYNNTAPPLPDTDQRTIYRVRVQASTAEAGLHTVGVVLTNGNNRGMPNRTLFVASMPGAISWAAEVVAILPGRGDPPQLEPASYGFSECPVCIEPGITPLNCQLEAPDAEAAGETSTYLLAPGTTTLLGAPSNNRRLRRVYANQPGTGAVLRWYYATVPAVGSSNIILPAGSEYELATFDRLHHTTYAWDLLLSNNAGTGNLLVAVEFVP